MSKPVLLDGAAGTALWAMAEAAGVPKEPVWKYNIEHPDFVLELHRRYIEAGCSMIQANTFSANRFFVRRASSYSTSQVVSEGVRLAKQAASGTDVKVYMSVGPLPFMLAPYGSLKKDEAAEAFSEIFTAGAAAGADWIMLETFMDVEMMRIAAAEAVKTGLPVICSMTFEKRRRTMLGDSVEKIVRTLEPLGIAGIGMNCSAGPVEALEIIREYHEKTALPLYFKPNSGMGDTYSPKQFAEEVRPALDFVSYIGGCCGCGPEHIMAIRDIL